MTHQRLITLKPGETYRFKVSVPDVEGASLLLENPPLSVGAGESVEICVQSQLERISP
jgi:hypothetical protein